MGSDADFAAGVPAPRGAVVSLRQPKGGQEAAGVVLVAEADLVRLLEPKLRAEGLAVTVADSAEAASALTRSGLRGLYLLDVLLPGMMGMGGTLHALFGEDPKGCFWLLTPASGDQVSRDLLESLADHRLPRPWDEPSARRVAAEVSRLVAGAPERGP